MELHACITCRKEGKRGGERRGGERRGGERRGERGGEGRREGRGGRGEEGRERRGGRGEEGREEGIRDGHLHSTHVHVPIAHSENPLMSLLFQTQYKACPSAEVGNGC